MQTLMNRVVLAVDGKNRHAARARSGRDQRAGHHQHFLVCEGDGLSRVDRRQNRFERRRAGRGANHDVGVGMRGDGDQTGRRLPVADAQGRCTFTVEFGGLLAQPLGI